MILSTKGSSHNNRGCTRICQAHSLSICESSDVFEYYFDDVLAIQFLVRRTEIITFITRCYFSFRLNFGHEPPFTNKIHNNRIT